MRRRCMKRKKAGEEAKTKETKAEEVDVEGQEIEEASIGQQQEKIPDELLSQRAEDENGISTSRMTEQKKHATIGGQNGSEADATPFAYSEAVGSLAPTINSNRTQEMDAWTENDADDDDWWRTMITYL